MSTETANGLLMIKEQSHKILTDISEGGLDELHQIERAARTSYGSLTFDDDVGRTKKFIQSLINRGHESVLEHSSLTVRFVTDRAIANELVRHRLASFTQESTRYCNYKDRGLTVIEPITRDGEFLKGKDYDIWFESMVYAAKSYSMLIDNGCSPEVARDLLPSCTATKVVVTANYREWRHILKLRTAMDAHPKMRDLVIPLLIELQSKIPVIFDDIPVA